MKKYTLALFAIAYLIFPQTAQAQFNEDKVGVWGMYFFDAKVKDTRWGFQGDVQYRNWDFYGDLEQLLLRGGLTYSPKNADIKFTLGYGNITSGAFGESDETSKENRIYQEAIFPVQFGNRFYTNHRFRYEQRFLTAQIVTRYRYNIFLNVALNKPEMSKNTVYLAMYNELFINGERELNHDRELYIFDRNRFYVAFGYIIKKGMKVQLGSMKQTTNAWNKNQVQVSFHHQF